MFYVDAVGCHLVLNNNIFVCCFVRDDVDSTFIILIL